MTIRIGLLALVTCMLAFGQSAGPAFEVASVKPTPPSPDGRVFFMPPKGGPGTSDPGRISWPGARMISVIAQAFDVKALQIAGPGWIETARFDFEVTVPDGATKEQVSRMWQNLLAERFGMVVHHESREFQVQELVQAKGGAKLRTWDGKASTPKDGPAQIDNSGKLDRPAMVTMIRPGQNGVPSAHLAAQGQQIDQLVRMLSDQLRLPVVDRTGLTGKYDFELDFTPEMRGMTPLPGPGPLGPGPVGSGPPASGASASDPGISMASALQQIGLRLNSTKANLDVVVIDKLSMTPTQN